MTHGEDHALVGLYWIMAAVAVSTEYRLARHQAPAYLWMRLSIPVYQHMAPFITGMGFSLTLGVYTRDNVPWWLAIIATTLFYLILWRLSCLLGDMAAERAINRFRRMYPNYCPVCVFVYYGLRRGYCKPGFKLPGHDAVHLEMRKAAEHDQ